MALKQKGSTANKTIRKGVKRTHKVPEGVPKPKQDPLLQNPTSEGRENPTIDGSKNPTFRKPPIKKKGALSHATRKILQAMECGVPAKDAYEVVIGRTPSEATVYALSKKLEHARLTDPRYVEAAKKTLMRAMKLKVTQRVGVDGTVHEIVPTYSHALTAASMVMERAEPAIKMQMTATTTISPVDLSRFLNPTPDSNRLAEGEEQNLIDLTPSASSEDSE